MFLEYRKVISRLKESEMQIIDFFPELLLKEMSPFDLERLKTHESSGLSIDTRTLRKGDFFIALKGRGSAGALFLKEAIERGASGVLISATDLKNLHTQGEESILKSISFWVSPRETCEYVADMAALYYPFKPEYLMAVTGTNGKTSVSFFVHQIMYALGLPSAALGTVGLFVLGGHHTQEEIKYSNLTTPDVVKVHKILSELFDQGVQSLVLEASSHGIDQNRLKGLTFSSAAFTNFSQDHLDYHGSMAEYFDVKCRLFQEILLPGKTAVLNADIPEFDRLEKIVRKRKQHLLTYGLRGEDLRLLNLKSHDNALEMEFEVWGEKHSVRLPLIGNYQAHNVLCALGLVMGALKITSHDTEILNKAIQVLSYLQPPPGRLEFVGKTRLGASVYVDYAHTPDAFERVLTSLRPHTKRRLWILFGCGGDRDSIKRSLMGKMAYQYADFVVITDDNPRSEDPKNIRKQVMEYIPECASNVFEIPDREVQ